MPDLLLNLVNANNPRNGFYIKLNRKSKTVPPSTIKKRATNVALFLICMNGEGFNPFLWVQRERAEAEILLFVVMKSRKQNTELPLNASDQDKSRHRHHKNTMTFVVIVFSI